MSDPTYTVKFSGYCGMGWPLEEGLDWQGARDCVARTLRARRRERLIIARSRDPDPQDVNGDCGAWECTESEDHVMVPDTAGWLTIVRNDPPMGWCPWCGEEIPIDEECDCLAPIEEEGDDEEGAYFDLGGAP